MCQACGCSQIERTSTQRILTIQESLLAKNNRTAAQNRRTFQSHQLLVLNVLSSPGSGKTTWIERQICDLNRRSPKIGAIVGDLATDRDAQRLRNAGVPAIQITTGQACHLEAEMIAQAITGLNLPALDLLIIENVGNLVCPAVYDLGETLRVVLISVTEGEDKPLKYPAIFKSADVIVINKLDIAEAVGFDRKLAIANIHQINPQACLFTVSARTGEGMNDWYGYLEKFCLSSRLGEKR